MISLPNGCRCSEPNVYPQNWKTGGSRLLKVDWYITYRFYDPANKDHPRYGKPKMIKAGINRFTTLEERRAGVEKILTELMEALVTLGYNPLTETTLKPLDQGPADIDTSTPFADALTFAYSRCKKAPSTMKDLAEVRDNIIAAARDLGYADYSISAVKRKYLVFMLEACAKRKGDKEFSNHRYNKHRTYLMMLYKKLVEMEAIDADPVEAITILPTVKKLKPELSDDERILIDARLKKNVYSFWRLLHVFFHSGAREREIMDVKTEDVNLKRGMIKYTVLKGGVYHEVERPIKDCAMYLWQEIITEAKPGDYLFSVGLKPGPQRIRTDQIHKRWRRWVHLAENEDGTKMFKTKAGFYILKYLNTTETANAIGTKLAAQLNSHSEAVMKKHYDLGAEERNNLIIKSVNNQFAPVKVSVN